MQAVSTPETINYQPYEPHHESNTHLEASKLRPAYSKPIQRTAQKSLVHRKEPRKSDKPLPIHHVTRTWCLADCHTSCVILLAHELYKKLKSDILLCLKKVSSSGSGSSRSQFRAYSSCHKTSNQVPLGAVQDIKAKDEENSFVKSTLSQR